MRSHTHYQEISDDRSGERGVALFVALVLIVLLTFLGFGLLARSSMSSRIAGLERWPAKTFYAADGGINAATARLRIRQTDAMTYDVADLRGPTAVDSSQPITVAVTDMAIAGPPRPDDGSQIGGGAGGAESLYIMFYTGTSNGFHAASQSRRSVTATIGIGPTPLSIPGS